MQTGLRAEHCCFRNQKMTRLAGLDALRGLMLVLMTVSHIPTSIGSALGQPFGYVSAAEGFVLLSGFFAGMVFSRKLERHGAPAMRTALQRRAGQIYLCHIGLLMFLFTIIAAMGLLLDQPAITNLLGYYFDQPTHAMVGGLLLVHRPPLLDILPMYTVFLIITPLLLTYGARGGWPAILTLSGALWLGAQFGLGGLVYEGLGTLLNIPVPLNATGAFALPAWQLLWVGGLWLGARHIDEDSPLERIPKSVLMAAVLFVVLTFAWRHLVGQTPLPDWPAANHLFDKWQLGPLRMLNVIAMAIVLAHYGSALMRALPSMRYLETLGSASLQVFCAHLVLTFLALALLGDGGHPLWLEVTVLGGSLLVLYRIALANVSRRPAPVTRGQLA